MNAAPKQPLNALVGIRFLGAIQVVLHHHLILTPGFQQSAPGWLQRFIAAAPITVEMFFVLSGFVLAYNYLDLKLAAEVNKPAAEVNKPAAEVNKPAAEVNKKDFWKARFARLYPMYIIALLIYFPIALTRYASGTGLSFINIGPAPTFFVSGILSLLFLQSWTVVFNAWNPPCWSVSTEAFFYALFPKLGTRLKSLTTKRLFEVASILWIASLIPPAYFVIVLLGRCTPLTKDIWEIALMQFPLFRLIPFLIGVATGIVFLRNRNRPFAKVSWLLNAAVASVILLYAFVPTPFGRLLENSMTPLFALMLYLLALERGLVYRFLAHRVLVLLGEASYAIYLLHTALWNFFARRNNIWSIVFHRHFPSGHPVPGGVTEWNHQLSLPEFAAYLILVVGISVLAMIYIERPMRLALNRRFKRPERHPEMATLAASAS